MTAFVLRGDARALPLPDNSVDLIVTSPPYFGLRSYQDGGEHYEQQIGSEATPTEFVAALIEVTRECVRVLRPTGSLWVNLGDKYASYEGNRQASQSGLVNASQDLPRVPKGAGLTGGGAVRNKSLMAIPWRYAIACTDDLGLILRAEVVWAKPNGLPESVSDRVRRAHETWLHFTPQPRYYANLDTIRQVHKWQPSPGYKGHVAARKVEGQPTHQFKSGAGGPGAERHPLGALPGSVWEVPTEPLHVPDHLGVKHYAAFPTEWPKRIIRGWSPERVCVECGEGRRPLRGTECVECGTLRPTKAKACPGCGHVRDWKAGRVASEAMGASDWSTAGHGTPRHPGGHQARTVAEGETCGCDEPTGATRPGVVLDPFGGTGTTALVASVLGRTGITVDRSFDYCRVAQWRTGDRNQRAKVLGLPKVEAQPEDQSALF